MPWCLGSVPQLSQCFACFTSCCRFGKLYGMPALHLYSSPPWSTCHIALCFPLLQQVQGWGGGWPLNRKRFRRNVVQHVQHFWVASRYPSSFPSPFPHLSVHHPSLCSKSIAFKKKKSIAFVFKVPNVARENNFSLGIFFSIQANWNGLFCLTLRRQPNESLFLKFLMIISSSVFRVPVRNTLIDGPDQICRMCQPSSYHFCGCLLSFHVLINIDPYANITFVKRVYSFS